MCMTRCEHFYHHRPYFSSATNSFQKNYVFAEYFFSVLKHQPITKVLKEIPIRQQNSHIHINKVFRVSIHFCWSSVECSRKCTSVSRIKIYSELRKGLWIFPEKFVPPMRCLFQNVPANQSREIDGGQ